MEISTGPSEGMSVTLPPGGRREPDRGLIEITSPLGTVSLCWPLPIATDKSADVSSPRAVLTAILATLGTLTYRPEASHQPSPATRMLAGTRMMRLLNGHRG